MILGADICGFFTDVGEELCARWMQLGAFYPFSRNHNAKGYAEQDPGSSRFSDNLRIASEKAYKLRYSLLPELNSLFAKVHESGGTVVKSLAEV